MSTEAQDAVVGEVPAELAEALAAAVHAGPMSITRVIVPNPGMKYGKLTDLAADVVFRLPEGAPEPMALSLFTPDSTEAYVFVISPQLKASILKEMTGGVDIASPADLAREITKT